ncbi:MAG: chemotaxis protein CheB [Bacteroidota bacterium]|nr:chemotaxis protein CheB [Bacteroidota bacterium]
MKSGPIIKNKKPLPKKKSLIRPAKPKRESFHIVAIGASAGGLEAVSALLKNLPPDTGMAYIYVQHLNPEHKSYLTSILSKITKMKVQEIDDMELMKPDNVYVIPHNKEIEVIDGHIQLLPRQKNIPTNPSIDILFTSLAETHKEKVIGIILSGYGSDGTQGLNTIKDAGGITFAQDDSAQTGSMPKSAIASGVVDYVLPPEEIAHELIRLSKNGFLKQVVKPKRGDTATEYADPDEKTIFRILHKDKGVDFSHYKMATINRRLHHRMQQCRINSIKDYVKLLLKDGKEADLLYKDLLINVTSFFRDMETFRYLKSTLLPELLKGKLPGETLRIWVPACSTGEEAYSIALLIAELQYNKTKKVPVKIFATDLSEGVIQCARLGEFTQNETKPIPKNLLKRFFTKSGDRYIINKEIREMFVFAPHNILSDPPFFRIDFISCRNLLIYFDAAAQKKALATLHFALNEGKYLILGKSETIGTSSQLFTQLNNKFKIFSRKKNTGIRKVPELLPRFPLMNNERNIKPSLKKNASVDTLALDNAIDSALLSRFMPACAIINKDMEILQFRGLTSLYLSHPSGGKASLNILKMTRPEFAFELRNAILKVIKTKQPVIKTGIEIKVESAFRLMTLEVCPLKIEWDEPLLLCVFTMQEQVEIYPENSTGSKRNLSQKDTRIKKLVEELNSARSEMDSILESQETAYEELQTANEEIVSTNEEFQTLNEELETSKEEIQATNEELLSANHELQIRNDLLTEAQEYSEAIITTIHEPMLVLFKDFRVKSANKSFYEKFKVQKEETEGTYLFELGNKQWNIPKLRNVLNDIIVKNSSFENFEVTYNFPGIGEKIMLLNAHLIVQKSNTEQLILLAIEDFTVQKSIEKQLLDSKILAEVAQQKAEEALKKAEEAVKAKQQFLSNMSHEIRTPMNGIIGFTKVLLKTDLSLKQKEYLRAIKLSGDALIVLINDILDLAKVDAGKMTFEQKPFNLILSTSSTLHLFEAKIHEKNLKLVIDYDKRIPEILVGDSVRLRQILLNLLSNAVKFTSKGEIAISVRQLAADNKKVTIEFTLSDTGIGISKNKIDKIFENFQQASNDTSRLYGGTGLGLAIFKQLVELQGGSIHVKSKLDVGSTFSFKLDFKKTKSDAEPEVEIAELDTEINNIKVLVVEDIPLNQLLMKTLLEDFGFERDIAPNGKVAIEKLQVKNYDIVLMDLQMPEMNGFEATNYIRNTMKSKIPIIAVSADVTTVDLAKCKAVGMNDYISKPIDERQLYNKIVGLVLKPGLLKVKNTKLKRNGEAKKLQYVDLDILNRRTKSNPKLMMEMIQLYLNQTPPIISAINKSLKENDWNLLKSAVHKIMPSFSIMGIQGSSDLISKKILGFKFKNTVPVQSEIQELNKLATQLETVCKNAMKELKEEFNRIRNLHQ